MHAWDERIQSLRKTYAEIAQHLDPEARANFESVPPERRDWFKRQMMEDTLVPGAMNKYAYQTMGVANKKGVHGVLDLNDLKALNDTHGHEHGDKTITAVGSQVLEHIRKNGGQLFRTGGDEFQFFFPHDEANPDAARNGAHLALRGAHSAVGGLTPVGGTHKPSFSVGLGHTPAHADKALYMAKGAKTAKFGELRRDPNAKVGHGQNFAHSLLDGSAGAVSLSDEPTIPEALSKPKPTGPLTVPRV